MSHSLSCLRLIRLSRAFLVLFRLDVQQASTGIKQLACSPQQLMQLADAKDCIGQRRRLNAGLSVVRRDRERQEVDLREALKKVRCALALDVQVGARGKQLR